MSYEGYERLLCANGHLWENHDIYNYNNTFEEKCPVCDAECVFYNAVDTTNGSFDIDSDGNETDVRIDNYLEFEILAPQVLCTCKCGNTHASVVQTYKLPPRDVGHHHAVQTREVR
jgi:hypothetical protein